MRVLFNSQTNQLQPPFVKALKRIFRLWQLEGTTTATTTTAAESKSADSNTAATTGGSSGVATANAGWSDAQIDSFQSFCFGRRLVASDISDLKALLIKRQSDAIDTANGGRLTFSGFCLFFQLFIEKRRTDAAWMVLDKFGYGVDIKLRSDSLTLPHPLGASASSSGASGASGSAKDECGNCELSPVAIDWLVKCFHRFDTDRDGALSGTPTAAADSKDHKTSGSGTAGSSELSEVFAPSPVPAFTADSFPYLPTASDRGLSVEGWLSQWSSLLLFNPIGTCYHLAYIGMPKQLIERDAIVIRPAKRQERTSSYIERRSVYALVFGSSNSGKTTLVRSLIGKPIPAGGEHVPTRRVRTYAGVLSVAPAATETKQAGGAEAVKPVAPASSYDRLLVATEVPSDSRAVDSIFDDSLPLQKCKTICSSVTDILFF